MKIQAGRTQLSRSLRLIVIDDNPDWCTLVRRYVMSLRHTVDDANTIEEAQRKILEAENQNEHYAIAIIDMNFKAGGEERLEGTYLIDYIKENHPYIACVVASGEKVAPDDVLDLRDDHQLDYYLQKDRISPQKFQKAIQRSHDRLKDVWDQYIPASPVAAPPAEKPGQTAPAPATNESRIGAIGTGQNPASVSQNTSAVAQVQLDFQVEDDRAQIIWRTPSLGRKVTTFSSPYSPAELALVIRALDIVQHPNYPNPRTEVEQRRFTFAAAEQARLAQLGLWHENQVAIHSYQVVGQALYEGLGATGKSVLREISNVNIAHGLTTNYLLRFPPEAINLAALPWELLWDQERNQAVLIRGDKIDSCERYVDLEIALPPPLAGGQKLHLLALSPSYGIPDEIRQIERGVRLRTWDKLKAEGKITYDELHPLTMADLNDYMDQLPTRPDIVHYFGHGTYRAGEGYLFFDDGRGGRDLVSTRRLAAALGGIRLIVIHACQSAMIEDEGGLLTGVAPALSIVAGAVVAMQLTVRTDSAARFAQVFYEQLLNRGRSLQEAVAQGRQRLFTEVSDGASWYVPTLYIRSREARPIYFLS